MINEAVKYIIQLLNIDTNNSFIVEDITQELSNIENPQEFVKFVRNNLNISQLDYKNGFQKFVYLADKYKQSLLSSDEKIELFCKKLIEKCIAVSRNAEEYLPTGQLFYNFAKTATYENFKYVGKTEPIFCEKEIKLLDEVGGCRVWLIECEEYSFLAKLINAIKKFNKMKLLPNKNLIESKKVDVLEILKGGKEND